jgi:hypothetical protein
MEKRKKQDEVWRKEGEAKDEIEEEEASLLPLLTGLCEWATTLKCNMTLCAHRKRLHHELFLFLLFR